MCCLEIFVFIVFENLRPIIINNSFYNKNKLLFVTESEWQRRSNYLCIASLFSNMNNIFIAQTIPTILIVFGVLIACLHGSVRSESNNDQVAVAPVADSGMNAVYQILFLGRNLRRIIVIVN